MVHSINCLFHAHSRHQVHPEKTVCFFPLCLADQLLGDPLQWDNWGSLEGRVEGMSEAGQIASSSVGCAWNACGWDGGGCGMVLQEHCSECVWPNNQNFFHTLGRVLIVASVPSSRWSSETAGGHTLCLDALSNVWGGFTASQTLFHRKGTV